MALGFLKTHNSSLKTYSVVILQPQVRDQIFAFQMTKRVLQLHCLDE